MGAFCAREFESNGMGSGILMIALVSMCGPVVFFFLAAAKWDGIGSLSGVQVFIPLWITAGLIAASPFCGFAIAHIRGRPQYVVFLFFLSPSVLTARRDTANFRTDMIMTIPVYLGVGCVVASEAMAALRWDGVLALTAHQVLGPVYAVLAALLCVGVVVVVRGW
jgi:hypothetical protein